jgi:hypothetical protein
MRPATFFTGRLGCTTSTYGPSASFITGVKSLIGSYGICLYRCGLITCVVEIMSRLYPSGADLATSVVPMVEPAPGLFSITIGWPMAGASSF